MQELLQMFDLFFAHSQDLFRLQFKNAVMQDHDSK